MKYKGIEYRVLQSTTPDVWAWSFDPPRSVPVHGKAHGNRLRATTTAQFAIDKWLRANAAESEC
jgi:hypothetical protein